MRESSPDKLSANSYNSDIDPGKRGPFPMQSIQVMDERLLDKNFGSRVMY